MAADTQCSFQSFHSTVNCSNLDTFYPVNSFPTSLSTILLTESGLLFTKFTESFIICQSHLNELQEQNRLRKKSKCCGIPLHLSSHNLKNKKRSGKLKADRYLTSQQVEEISKKYGSVLPVGTRKFTFYKYTSYTYITLCVKSYSLKDFQQSLNFQ